MLPARYDDDDDDDILVHFALSIHGDDFSFSYHSSLTAPILPHI